ncbi:hypothetical protein [Streptomyces purpureus]|uniref:Uncharacterized protein n=1 Tax=Streptomyces purpureus TaxID=1951 RepID=A0A918GW83_9ACTN|nr:hypothetical protein [Streptomyces purpureus]GGT12572.1 hypothetical protein GCM10014713_01230 [Streptomyces purpureus]
MSSATEYLGRSFGRRRGIDRGAEFELGVAHFMEYVVGGRTYAMAQDDLKQRGWSAWRRHRALCEAQRRAGTAPSVAV